MAKKQQVVPAEGSSVVAPEDVATLHRMVDRVNNWDAQVKQAEDKLREAEEKVNTLRSARDTAVVAYNREIEWLRREHGVPAGVPVEFKDKDGGIVITWTNPEG